MAPFVEQMLNKRVAVRLHTDQVVSWDHRKLAPPARAALDRPPIGPRGSTRRRASRNYGAGYQNGTPVPDSAAAM